MDEGQGQGRDADEGPGPEPGQGQWQGQGADEDAYEAQLKADVSKFLLMFKSYSRNGRHSVNSNDT